ncbi:MAG: hypothetical protein LBS52_01775 [Dysgonamonadaceae bacterium]|jgi:hypothetical protein|nr:hypothetical protein [Dysgonamonadaceae bacterium]
MKNEEALQTVKEIKTLMEQSSKFLSFSGLSAVIVGAYALVAAYVAQQILDSATAVHSGEYSASEYFAISHVGAELALKLLALAIAVFLLSWTTVLFLAWRKARRINARFFSRVTYRTALHFFLPLFTGGIFCFALLFNGYVALIAPAMLLFYGLSLVDIAKYTHKSFFLLGCAELCLGIICAFLPGKGLLFWAVGFGVLHVIYGLCYYFGVERAKKSGR